MENTTVETCFGGGIAGGELLPGQRQAWGLRRAACLLYEGEGKVGAVEYPKISHTYLFLKKLSVTSV